MIVNHSSDSSFLAIPVLTDGIAIPIIRPVNEIDSIKNSSSPSRLTGANVGKTYHCWDELASQHPGLNSKAIFHWLTIQQVNLSGYLIVCPGGNQEVMTAK